MRILKSLLAVLIVAIIAVPVISQTKTSKYCFTKHSTALSYYQSLKILPVEVVDIQADRIGYRYEDQHTILVGHFVPTKDTVFPKNFNSRSKARTIWMALYCDLHNEVLKFDDTGLKQAVLRKKPVKTNGLLRERIY